MNLGLDGGRGGRKWDDLQWEITGQKHLLKEFST